MSLASPLDQIFRRLDHPGRADGRFPVLRVNKRTRRAEHVESAGGFGRMLGRMFSDHLYYEIQCDTPVVINLPNIEIETFETRERVNLEIRIKLSIPETQVIPVAEALYDSARAPSEVFANTLEDIIRDESERTSRKNRESVIRQIRERMLDWVDHVETRLGEILKVRATVVITLPPEADDPKTQVRPLRKDAGPHESTDSISVYPMDSPDGIQTIEVTAHFEASGYPAQKAPPQNSADWTRWLETHVARCYRDEILLYHHWFEPDIVKQKILDRLNHEAMIFGRRVSHLYLKFPPSPLRPERSEQIVPTTCQWTGPANYPVTFATRAHLMLDEDGAGRFAGNRPTSLHDWLTRKVGPAIEAAMFGKDFFDLSESGLDAVRLDAYARLAHEAKKIGHSLKVLVVTSELPDLAYLKPFEVTVQKQKYQTGNPLVAVRIEIGIKMHLKDLRPVGDHLVRKNFTTEIQRIARETLEAAMKTVDANDYFANWQPWRFNGVDEEDPVTASRMLRDQLTEGIRRALLQYFDPTAFVDGMPSVHLRRVDNEVVELNAQAERLTPIRVSCKILSEGIEHEDQASTVTVNCAFRGIYPDEVVNVMQRGEDCFNPQRMTKDLADQIQATLRPFSPDELNILNGDRHSVMSGIRDRISERLGVVLAELMKSRYGVQIMISYVERSISREDETRQLALAEAGRDHRALIDDRADSREQGLAFRKQKRRKLLEELEGIDDRIYQLQLDDNPNEDKILSLERDRQTRIAQLGLAMPDAPLRIGHDPESPTKPDF